MRHKEFILGEGFECFWRADVGSNGSGDAIVKTCGTISGKGKEFS